MSPETLEDIRSEPPRAHDRVHDLPDSLDVDRDWKRLAALLDLAGFPVNPMTGGEVFPDERYSWGGNGDALALTTEQVTLVADRLAGTPFDQVAQHLPHLHAQGWQSVHPDGHLHPITAEEDMAAAVRERLAEAYAQLTAFFAAAAANGQRTIFWAA